MPNGRAADIVFVEKERITVVEVKKTSLSVSMNPKREDAVDQIIDYLAQCVVKYPGRLDYRGFIVGTRIADKFELTAKLSTAPFTIIALVFGIDIPSSVKMCSLCRRAVSYETSLCRCGVRI